MSRLWVCSDCKARTGSILLYRVNSILLGTWGFLSDRRSVCIGEYLFTLGVVPNHLLAVDEPATNSQLRCRRLGEITTCRPHDPGNIPILMMLAVRLPVLARGTTSCTPVVCCSNNLSSGRIGIFPKPNGQGNE